MSRSASSSTAEDAAAAVGADAIVRGFVQTPGGQLHFRERPGTGTPVLLLHQTPSSSVMWERLMAAYPPGRRLLAVDTPGFGASQAPSALPAEGIAYYAGRVVEFLDALGVETVDVVGFHTGAVIATELGAAAPDRVGRIVFIGNVASTLDEGRDRLDHITRWNTDATGEYVAATLLPHMRQRVTGDDPGHFATELMATMQAGPDWWWAYDAVFTYDARARLPLISAPSLFAVGDDEEEQMLRWSELSAELAQDAEYRVLEGLGVEMAFEAPGRMLAVIESHLG